MNDPIVEEVRRIRARIAEEHGNDLHRIFEDARRREGAEGRPVISFDKAAREEQSCVVREKPPAS
jgi:hypothetical protein